MAISMNRIHTKDEIREMLEVYFKYRPEEDYKFKLSTSWDKFEMESIRLNKEDQSK